MKIKKKYITLFAIIITSSATIAMKNSAQRNKVVYEPTKEEILMSKRALSKKGFDVDISTSNIDKDTRKEILRFQYNNTLEPTGVLDLATIKELKGSQTYSE